MTDVACEMGTRWLTGGHAALVYRSPKTEQARLTRWLSVAVERGDRVIYKHTGATQPTLAGLPRTQPGQLEFSDAATVHADTGGSPAALRDWHHALLGRAARDGYHGVSIACDSEALAVIAPDPAARITHETDLTELATTRNLRVLCRYPVSAPPDRLLPDLVAAHAPGIEDIDFAATRRHGRLVLAGEIDLSNADRFAAVLHAAIRQGIRDLDLTDLVFLGANGAQALTETLQPLAAAGESLTVRGACHIVSTVLDVAGLTTLPTLQFVPA